jgi:hypothetical protein
MDEALVNIYIYDYMLPGRPRPADYEEAEWQEAFDRFYIHGGAGINPIYLTEVPPPADGYINTCEGQFGIGANIIESDCDCWANGTDYMSFGWEGNPGCCYGCMDPTDFRYHPWATCHVQEACRSQCSGNEWSWIDKWNEVQDDAGPFGSDVGCWDENGVMYNAFGDLETTPCESCGGQVP